LRFSRHFPRRSHACLSFPLADSPQHNDEISAIRRKSLMLPSLQKPSFDLLPVCKARPNKIRHSNGFAGKTLDMLS